MSSKKGTLFVGASGICECCGNKTPFSLCSTEQEPKTKEWRISHAMQHSILDTLVDRVMQKRRRTWSMKDLVDGTTNVRSTYGFQCVGCMRGKSRVVWIEMSPGVIIGPYCESCLRYEARQLGHAEDGCTDSVRMFTMTANKGTVDLLRLYKMARNNTPINLVEEVTTSPPEVEEIQLF